MENIHIGFCNRAAIAKERERERNKKREKSVSKALDPTDKRKQFWLQDFVIVYVFIYPTRLYDPVNVCSLVTNISQ